MSVHTPEGTTVATYAILKQLLNTLVREEVLTPSHIADLLRDAANERAMDGSNEAVEIIMNLMGSMDLTQQS